MKMLNQFQSFDWNKFANGKTFLSAGTRPWRDFETKRQLGTIVDAVIYKDQTEYRLREGETGISNRWEKIGIKVAKQIEVPADVQIRPVGVTATIYGDYRNQLSVKAEDIQIVSPERKAAH